MNDTQSDLLGNAGKIYPGKIDSLVVHGGAGRVLLTGLMTYAHTANECLIRWETDSLDELCYGTSYGENFIHSATAKYIIGMTVPDPTGIVISWSASANAANIEVEYDSKSTNEPQTLLLSGDATSTKIADWKIGGNIKFRTGLIPEIGGIDTLLSEWIELSFPTSVEYLLNKSIITMMGLTYDAGAYPFLVA